MSLRRVLKDIRCYSVSQHMLLCGAAPLLPHAPSMSNPRQTCTWKSESGNLLTGCGSWWARLIAMFMHVPFQNPSSKPKPPQSAKLLCGYAFQRVHAHTRVHPPATTHTASRPNNCVQSDRIIHVQSCQTHVEAAIRVNHPTVLELNRLACMAISSTEHYGTCLQARNC